MIAVFLVNRIVFASFAAAPSFPPRDITVSISSSVLSKIATSKLMGRMRFNSSWMSILFLAHSIKKLVSMSTVFMGFQCLQSGAKNNERECGLNDEWCVRNTVNHARKAHECKGENKGCWADRRVKGCCDELVHGTFFRECKENEAGCEHANKEE